MYMVKATYIENKMFSKKEYEIVSYAKYQEEMMKLVMFHQDRSFDNHKCIKVTSTWVD